MYESACCQGIVFAVVFSLSRAFLQGRAGEVLPFPSMVTKTENCLCASHPIFAGMVLSYEAKVALS